MDSIVTTSVIATRDRALFAVSCRWTPQAGSTRFGTQDKHTLLGIAPPTAPSP